MKDHATGEHDPFYFSDSIQEIDEEAPFIRLRLFQQLKSLVAILCVDATSGETSIHPLERKDAPPELQAITSDTYNVGMRFHTPRSTCYCLVERFVGGDRESG